jgi:uncharacterized pyridoxal phosphate-dependent enzyme
MALKGNRWSRRDVLKQTGLLSMAAVSPAAAFAATEANASTTPVLPSKENLYTQIGVRPLINARGTYTIITGSQSLPEVKSAMFEASQHYVHLDELMPAVGAESAQHMGAPSAIVTCGCEAAIALATAACICGSDPEASQSYPYRKVKNEIIIPKYARNPYDFGIRMSGPQIVEVETDEELRKKINDKTAMIYILSGPRAFQEPLSILTICAIAKEKDIPVFVDAAAEEPLVPNVHLAAGATFVGYSGGKCMRGPQTAGVLLGPKDLVAAAFWNAAPHHNWGRALKVGKEEAMGMLAAVRQWYKRDHDAEQRQWKEWDQYIADALKGVPSVETQIIMPDTDLSNRAPVLQIRWDAAQVGITGTELVERLDKRSPRILVAGGTGRRPEVMQSSVEIMPYMLQPGEYKIVAEVLATAFKNPGKYENPPVYTGPTANVAGEWNVTVRYHRGTALQKLTLKQNGDEVTGELHGEVYNTTVKGKVTSDHAVLHGTMAGNGNPVPYTYTGVVSGRNFSGDVAMGEYGAASFSATRG